MVSWDGKKLGIPKIHLICIFMLIMYAFGAKIGLHTKSMQKFALSYAEFRPVKIKQTNHPKFQISVSKHSLVVSYLVLAVYRRPGPLRPSCRHELSASASSHFVVVACLTYCRRDTQNRRPKIKLDKIWNRGRSCTMNSSFERAFRELSAHIKLGLPGWRLTAWDFPENAESGGGKSANFRPIFSMKMILYHSLIFLVLNIITITCFHIENEQQTFNACLDFLKDFLKNEITIVQKVKKRSSWGQIFHKKMYMITPSKKFSL